MPEDYTITWKAEDVKTLRPEWTDQQCEDWLFANWKYVQDRSIEVGWEIIESLLQTKISPKNNKKLQRIYAERSSNNQKDTGHEPGNVGSIPTRFTIYNMPVKSILSLAAKFTNVNGIGLPAPFN